MTIISLRDYAKQKNVSYEAIRKQVARYKDELAGHIIMDGRQQFLDEEAVAFLDARRQKNPVVLYQANKDEEIERLRQEREKLLMKVAEQAVQIADLTQFKLEAAEQRQALEAAKTAQERRAQELQAREATIAQELSTAAQRAAEAVRTEAETEKRILEGFIQDAKNELTAAQEAHRQEMQAEQAKHKKTVDEMSEENAGLLQENVALSKKIQALEARTLWDMIREWIFGKGEQA